MTTRLGVVGATAFLAAALVVPLGAPVVADAVSSVSPVAWQAHLNLAGGNQLEDITCPTTRECVAVAGGDDNRGLIFRTTNAGATWERAEVPAQTPWLEFVSCPSATDCVASASGQVYPEDSLASNDGGARWRVTYREDKTQPFQMAALACVTATTCEAAGNGFFRSRNAGRTWSATTPELSRTTTGQNGLACPSVSTCFAIVGDTIDGPSGVPGTTILKTIDSGTSFSVLRDGLLSTGPGLTSISCISTIRCAVAGLGLTGRGVLWTVDGGSRWESTKVPSSLGAIEDVTCSGPGTCTLVAKASSASTTSRLVTVSTTTRGSTWNVHLLSSFVSTRDPSVDEQGAIACPTGGPCFVAGFGTLEGSVFTSAKGSRPWHRVAVANGLPPLLNVSCPTSQLCIAIGDQNVVLRSLDGGSAWSKTASQLPSNAFLPSLDCASATYCVAVGDTVDHSGNATVPAAFVSTDGGATWSASAKPAVIPLSLTCTSSMVCVGPDDGGGILRTVDGGTIWTPVSVPAGFNSGGDISCDAAGDCVGVANSCCVFGEGPVSSAILSTDAGATWTLLPPPPSWAAQVSCTTGLTCYLLSTDQAPTVESYSSSVLKTADGGQNWRAVPGPSTLGPLECTTVQCVGIATTPGDGNAVNSSVLWSGAIGSSGVSWSESTMPTTDVVLNALTQNPSGRWIVVGGNALNGPLVLTTP